MARARENIAQIFFVFGRNRPELAIVNELGEPDDRVQRRSKLVRHVGKKFALQPVGFLNTAVLLFQLFAPSADLLLCFLIGGVAKITCEQGWLVLAYSRDAQLDRKLGPVSAHRGHFNPLAEYGAFTCGEIMGHPTPMFLAQGRRNDQRSHRLADHVSAFIAEHLLRRWIKFEELPLVIHSDDAIQHRLQDRPLASFALAQRLLRRLAVGDFFLQVSVDGLKFGGAAGYHEQESP